MYTGDPDENNFPYGLCYLGDAVWRLFLRKGSSGNKRKEWLRIWDSVYPGVTDERIYCFHCGARQWVESPSGKVKGSPSTDLSPSGPPHSWCADASAVKTWMDLAP